MFKVWLAFIILGSLTLLQAIPHYKVCLDKQKGVPAWVCSPKVKGMVTARGMSEHTVAGNAFTLEVATSQARANFYHKVRKDLQLILHMHKIEVKIIDDNQDGRTLLPFKSMLFKKLTILKRWVDPQSKSYYVLIGMSKGAYKKFVLGEIKRYEVE